MTASHSCTDNVMTVWTEPHKVAIKLFSSIQVHNYTTCSYLSCGRDFHTCYYHTNSLFIYGCYILTPWCRVLLEKLTGLQLVKKFLAFHGTRRFITALTSVRHLSLSWAYIQILHTLKYHTYTNIRRELFFVLSFSLLIVKLKLLDM